MSCFSLVYVQSHFDEFMYSTLIMICIQKFKKVKENPIEILSINVD